MLYRNKRLQPRMIARGQVSLYTARNAGKTYIHVQTQTANAIQPSAWERPLPTDFAPSVSSNMTKRLRNTTLW